MAFKHRKTRGALQDEFSRAIIRFENEHLGRGTVDARTFIIEDMILIRMRGILTPAEQKLAEMPDGQKLVKETHRQRFETSRSFIENIVNDVIGCQVVSLYTDTSTRTGERIVVLTVDQKWGS
jgi:uncharacterized protein YbcI